MFEKILKKIKKGQREVTISYTEVNSDSRPFVNPMRSSDEVWSGNLLGEGVRVMSDSVLSGIKARNEIRGKYYKGYVWYEDMMTLQELLKKSEKKDV